MMRLTRSSVEENKKYKYRLLSGTFTSGQREDYLQLGSFTVKSEIEEVDISKYDQDLEGELNYLIRGHKTLTETDRIHKFKSNIW